MGLCNVLNAKLLVIDIKMTNFHSDNHRKLIPVAYIKSPVHIQMQGHVRKASVCGNSGLLNVRAGRQRNCSCPSLPATSSSESVRPGLATLSRIGERLQYIRSFVFSLYSLSPTVQSPRLFILACWPLSADDRCRHSMIDPLEDGHYMIVGENRRHRFLQDLVDFHCRTPIMPFSEVLTFTCGQVGTCLHYRSCIEGPELNSHSVYYIMDLCGL